jgi:hypothetical protein
MPTALARRTATEAIERSPPDCERAFLKLPCREPVDISVRPSLLRVSTDSKQVAEILRRNGRNSYTSVHTHPLVAMTPLKFICLPSATDVCSLLCQPDERAMVIAARSRSSGVVAAYSFIRKTKRTPKFAKEDRAALSFQVFSISFMELDILRALKEFHLQYRVLRIW